MLACLPALCLSSVPAPVGASEPHPLASRRASALLAAVPVLPRVPPLVANTCPQPTSSGSSLNGSACVLTRLAFPADSGRGTASLCLGLAPSPHRPLSALLVGGDWGALCLLLKPLSYQPSPLVSRNTWGPLPRAQTAGIAGSTRHTFWSVRR